MPQRLPIAKPQTFGTLDGMDKGYLGKEAEVWLMRTVLLDLLAFLVNLVLLLFVSLKETPLFWRDAGGYPIWLRELVLDTFYPMLCAQFIILILATLCQFRAWPMERALRLVGMVVLAFLWLLLGAVLVILLSNNIDNLLNGRDLHYHPA